MAFETLAALATLLGTAVSILALVQASGWLAMISCVLICLSIGLWFWVRRERSILNSASIVIEGHSIDSLNLANLRRKVNRTFVIQEAHHTVRIKGEDMEVTWRYTGFCRKDEISSIDFSVGSDARSPFDALDCVAFDLSHDPEMKHPISPTLAGPDGISKKISVAFLEPLKANVQSILMSITGALTGTLYLPLRLMCGFLFLGFWALCLYRAGNGKYFRVPLIGWLTEAMVGRIPAQSAT